VICFRVTRFCNAHCGFCLAPPDGGVHPSAAILKNRLDWLFARGVRTIHFCGGEPTIHRDLPELISYVSARGGKSKLTTNGIALAAELMPALRNAGTEVKVSLHGNQELHNAVVARDAFTHTTGTLKELLVRGISASVQTTIISGHVDVVLWIIGFCIEQKVRRVSFLPFIPRGSGYERRAYYLLSQSERRELRALLKQKRREHCGRLDIRLLDFNSRPIHVVEPDGRVILESCTESSDVLLSRIPEAEISIAQSSD